MSIEQWRYGMEISVDPQAVRNYTWDFSAWLEGDTLTEVEVEAVNSTAEVRSHDDSSAVVRVSEVATGAKVTVIVTTSAGLVDHFSVIYNPVER